jgi:hypothetical protein
LDNGIPSQRLGFEMEGIERNLHEKTTPTLTFLTRMTEYDEITRNCPSTEKRPKIRQA